MIMNVDIPELLETLKAQILTLAKRAFTDYAKEAQNDIEYILIFTEANLARWTKELQDGTLNVDDFKYYVNSQKDLLTLVSLKRKGISKIRADKFREDVFLIIISGVLEAVGI